MVFTVESERLESLVGVLDLTMKGSFSLEKVTFTGRNNVPLTLPVVIGSNTLVAISPLLLGNPFKAVNL